MKKLKQWALSMTKVKIGLILYRLWRLRKWLGFLRLELANTKITTGDLACLGRGLSELESGMYFLSCGGKIMTTKRDDHTSPMRCVASCSCLNTNSRGMALTTDGTKRINCPTMQVVGRLVKIKEKQRGKK